MGHRIAHVISTRGMGGAERFLAALVTGGHARGHEQVVLNPFATEAAAELGRLCDPVPCQARPCDRLIDVPSVRTWLKHRLGAFQPDVVHVMLFHAVLTSSFPRPLGSRRLLTNVSGDWAKTGAFSPLLRLVDRQAGRRFDLVVAISESVQDFLVNDYRYPPSKVRFIPLGWTGVPHPPNTADREPTIICVGALRPEKGHDILLAALPLVRREVPNARLVLVGDGVLRNQLEAQAASTGLSDCVVFLGSVPDVWSHMAEADVFAIASRSEAFGIAIAEAMAAGLPVVAPAVGGIPELVRPGVTGELFRPGDHADLAERLVKLLRSPDLRAQMGVAAKAAAEPLRMDKAVARYFDLYDELVGTTA